MLLRTTVGLGLALFLIGAAPPPVVTARAANAAGLDRIVLGASLFRAAWAYKHDRAWLEEQLDFLAQHDFDAIRVLGVVGDPAQPDYWDGREVDWRWPDYDAVIAGLTDLAFDRYGIRVQWTIFAGGPINDPADRDRVVDRFLQMSRGREKKILAFETANEYTSNGFQGDTGRAELGRLTRRLSDGTAIPVAASAHDPSLCPVYAAAGVDMATFHFDRDRRLTPLAAVAESGCPKLPPILSNNEPIGPGSSVTSESDPYALVAMAADTYLSGFPIYVFHSGPGVRDDPAHPLGLRPSRLEELRGINRIVGGLYALKAYLPPDVHTWTRRPREDPSHPLSIEGEVRSALAAERGPTFVVVLSGVAGPLVVTARRDMNVEAIDPPTGEVRLKKRLAAGERLPLEALSSYILIGS